MKRIRYVAHFVNTRSHLVRGTFVLALVACGERRAPAPPATVDPDLDAAIHRITDAHLAWRPSFAVELGYHEHDGAVPDRSAAAIASEIARLHEAETTLLSIEADSVDKQIVLAEIRKELFSLETRRRPFRDPFFYLRGFGMLTYVARDYAPIEERARALHETCEGAPAYYRQADENLERSLPRAWLGAAQSAVQGTIQFVTVDAKEAFPDDAELHACLDRLATELEAFRAALADRMPDATDDYALGADVFLAMLRDTEGIDLTLDELERIARDDLARNQAAIVEAARAIDPDRDAAAVIAEVSADKPAQDKLLEEATRMLDDLRAFVVAKDLVSIPRDEVAEARFSPPFFRGNFAGLGSAGPFEAVAQPSVFYITPPDPTWPPEQQLAYLPSRPDLLFIAAHEVWPGHFVQGMHERASGRRILQTFETNTTSEGWAHYVEEMMWDAGLGDGDPRAHIGQLKNALLRDVRFLVALGLHTGGMTVDEAVALFQKDAYADPGNAKQQAVRGTADPMYLGYTLGKLLIVDLRDDWLAANPGATLKQFHDTFLSYGEAPLPVIRAMMLPSR
jgi:uncharacterized protein (DUF885 family)